MLIVVDALVVSVIVNVVPKLFVLTNVAGTVPDTVITTEVVLELYVANKTKFILEQILGI